MKQIKQSILGKIQSGLLIAVVTGFALTPAFAADNGNVALSGTVDPVNELTATPQSGYNTLALGTGATDLLVAVVNEKNNDPDGYTVTLVSANAQANASGQAYLKGANVNNTDVVNYSIKYGAATVEAAVTLASGGAVVTSTTDVSSESGDDKNLQITFSASSWISADTYTDTLTLTIASK